MPSSTRFVWVLVLYVICVVTNQSAKLAVQAGAAGIIVSNHGARQLDYVPATIVALEEVCNSIYFGVTIVLH